MSKHSKKRRRAQRVQQQKHQNGGAEATTEQQVLAAKALAGASKPSTPATAAAADRATVVDTADPSAVVSPEEVLITVETLEALSSHVAGTASSSKPGDDDGGDDDDENPDLTELLDRPQYKDLRRALRPFLAAHTRRSDPKYRAARVTAALKSGRWGDALRAVNRVSEAAASATTAGGGMSAGVKRGTVQRWVRFCDECDDAGLRAKILHAALSCSPRDEDEGGGKKQEDDDEGGGRRNDLNKHDPRRALRELEEGTRDNQDSDDDDDDDAAGDDCEMRIVRATEWTVPGEAATAGDGGEAEQRAAPLSPEDKKRLDEIEIQTIHHIPAADRKPANHHDLNIYATPPDSIVMNAEVTLAKRHDVDALPGGAFLLSDVLTPRECQQLLFVAESRMGYVPDHPVSRPSPTGIDTTEWLVDPSILDSIHARILPRLTQRVKGEGVEGINARWRLFRYGPDSVYRPHIDGSWTGAGLDADTGKYTSDAHKGELRSRFTFLIYLNDSFEGGETTFYLPSGGDKQSKNKRQKTKSGSGDGSGTAAEAKKARGGKGGFETVAVKPRAGAALCFPQGNTASLLHEGSRVTSGDGKPKYVIRTDVLYRVKKSTGEGA